MIAKIIALILFVFLSTDSQANVTGVRRVVDMGSNSSVSVNDVTYTVDVSDTSGSAAGTGKKSTIKQLFKAADITVDGTNVGIGSPSPTQKVDVVGTVRATAFVGDGSGLSRVAGSASDVAYGPSWSGDTTTPASKNALYNKIQSIGSTSGGWTDGGSTVYNTTSTSNVSIGSTVAGSKLSVIGGGIASELVNKDWELIIPSPSGLTASTTEVSSFGTYKNNLYVGYDNSTNGNSSIYKWNGNVHSLFYTIGTGSNFEHVSALQEYNNKLYATNTGSKTGSGVVFVYDPNAVVSNFVQFPTSTSTTTNYLTAPNDSSNNAIFGSTSYSVEYYGRIDELGGGGGNNGWILAKAPTTQTSGWTLTISSSNRINVGIRESAGIRSTTTNNNAFTVGGLHDIIFSWTAGSAPTIYIDGVAASIATSTAATTPNDDTANTIIMGNRPDGTKTFGGTFKKVRIWRGYALTSGDVTNLYAGNTIANSPTGEYLFTEGTGTTTADSSGHGNTATLSGSVYWNNNLFEVAYAPGVDHMFYSMATFKGKLYAGQGFSTGAIYSYDGTSWATAYAGLSTYGLVDGLYVYKGRIYAALAGGGNGAIISSSDGLTWITEISGVAGSGFTRFTEFKGRLFVGNFTTSNQVYVRDDTSGTWTPAANLSGPNQCWGIESYNNALYVGCTVTGGAVVYKSYDGYTFNVDFTNNYAGGQGTEAFRMTTYNGSLYVGMGFAGSNKADIWRKTDSYGQLIDNISRFSRKFRGYTNSGVNWTEDPALISVSSPFNFDSNVGIGSPNAQSSLDVIGTVRATAFIGDGSALTGIASGGFTHSGSNTTLTNSSDNVGIGSATPGQKLDVTGSVRATAFIGDGSSLTGISGSISGLTTNLIPKATSSTTIGNGVITDNGNVGVSSTNPGQKLDVQGTVRATSFVGDGSALTGISSGGFTHSGSNTTLVNTGDNVGVGSASPGQKLDVNGTVRATAFSGPLTGNVTGNVTGTSGSTTGNAATATALAANGTNCSAGSYALGVDASGNSEGCTVAGGGSSQWTTANTNDVYLPNSGNVGIGTSNTTSSALAVTNGNVAIGTTASPSFLNVKGNVTIGTSGVAAPSNGMFVSGNVGIGTTVSTNALDVRGNIHIAGSSSMVWTDDNNMKITPSASTSAAMEFITGGSERMRLTSGNLSIGTQSASSKLFVLGNIGIGTVANDAYVTTAPSNGGMIMYGNLGVGSTSPGQALDVNGTVRASFFSGNGSSLTSITGTVSGLTTGTLPKASSATALTNSVITESSGNIGIGSATPGVTLDVNGTIRSTAINVATITGPSGDASFSNNVGIGSVNPAAALDVVGTVRISSGGAANTGMCWCSDGKTPGHFTGGTVTSATCANAGGTC